MSKLDRKNLESMKTLVNEYNATMLRYRTSYEGNECPTFKVSTQLLQHMMSMVYGRSVGDPTKLNRYKGWSEEVYGEFSSNLISQIVQEVPVKETDSFIDLGSGVGQVVLQVSAESCCKDSWGIEKQQHPAEYALVMKTNFERTVHWFAKKSGVYDVLQGDFMDEQWKERIMQADVIFVNNYAFGTELNQRLAERFKECKPGARIVSSRNFAPLSFTITDRTLGDLGCILKVRRVTCENDAVSWTSGAFDYYIQTVDWTMFQSYMDQEGIKRPIRCSTPEPELESGASRSATPKINDTSARDEKAAKAAAKQKEKAKAKERKNSKFRGLVQPAYRKRALTNVKQPATKRVKTSSSSSSSIVVRTASQFVAQSSDLVAELVSRCKPNIDTIASQMILKTQTMHLFVKDLNREVDEAKTRNSQLRKATMDETKDRFAAVAERSRTSGLNKRHRREADPQHIRLAIDVATEHEVWQRLRERLHPEVVALRQKEARLREVKAKIAPTAKAMAKMVEYLKLGNNFDWATVASPSADGIRSLRKGLSPYTSRGSSSQRRPSSIGSGSSKSRSVHRPGEAAGSGSGRSSSSSSSSNASRSGNGSGGSSSSGSGSGSRSGVGSGVGSGSGSSGSSMGSNSNSSSRRPSSGASPFDPITANLIARAKSGSNAKSPSSKSPSSSVRTPSSAGRAYARAPVPRVASDAKRMDPIDPELIARWRAKYFSAEAKARGSRIKPPPSGPPGPGSTGPATFRPQQSQQHSSSSQGYSSAQGQGQGFQGPHGRVQQQKGQFAGGGGAGVGPYTGGNNQYRQPHPGGGGAGGGSLLHLHGRGGHSSFRPQPSATT